MDINYSTLSTTLTSICWVLLALEGGRCLLSNRKCNWLFAPSYSTDSQQWSIRSASPIPQPHLGPWVAASALNSGSCVVVGSLQATDTVIGSRGGCFVFTLSKCHWFNTLKMCQLLLKNNSIHFYRDYTVSAQEVQFQVHRSSEKWVYWTSPERPGFGRRRKIATSIWLLYD